MPVRPTSASAAITDFALQRATHWSVSFVKDSKDGCPIWTAMKMVPATAAAAPAALVRPVAVMFMTAPGRAVPGGSGDSEDVRSRLGERTSHDDVTRLVIPPCRAAASRRGGRHSEQMAGSSCRETCRLLLLRSPDHHA